MSMPISRIASTAQGWTWPVGSMPALYASKRSPARWRNNPSAIWLLAEFWVHRKSTFCFLVSCSTILLPSSRPLRYFHRLGRSPFPQLIRELVGQIAAADGIDGSLQIVLDPDELRRSHLLVGLDQHVSGPPVAVLGLTDRSGVEEVNAFHNPMPGLVGVAEGDQASLSGPSRLRHLRAEGVGPVLGPVEGVQGGSAVHEGKRRATLVAAPWPEVHPEGQRPEVPLG